MLQSGAKRCATLTRIAMRTSAGDKWGTTHVHLGFQRSTANYLLLPQLTISVQSVKIEL